MLSHSSLSALCKLPAFKLSGTRDIKLKAAVFGNESKGKVVPLQAWSGPEGSRKLRFPDFLTMAQGDGKVVSLTHRPHLPPGNSAGTHFC